MRVIFKGGKESPEYIAIAEPRLPQHPSRSFFVGALYDCEGGG
jgi:hypothetical protein